MKQEKDFEHLEYALDNYKPLSLHISPFSLGNKEKSFHKNLEEKTLNFDFNEKELKFYINKEEIINLSQEKNYHGFKLEYQDSRGMRLLPQDQHPNNLIKEPDISAFRGIIEDYLVEIKFKGKILLKPEKDYSEEHPFWKLKHIM